MQSFVDKIAFRIGLRSADRRALAYFTHNFYLGELLSIQDAKKNIEQGVVELLHDEQHLGNGLLVTTNGYLLTAYHCVEEQKRLQIKTCSDERFPVVRTCCSEPSFDIALIKAKIPKISQPMVYKFFPKHLSSQFHREPAVVLSRRGSCVECRGGFTNGQFTHKLIYRSGEEYSQLATCSMVSRPGDSGGVVVTPKGEIIGILSGGDSHGTSTLASWYEALTVVSRYAHA